MKPVLVTGGSGFIGHHLTAALLKEGRNVVVIDRQPSSTGGIGFYRVDLTKNRSLPKDVDNCGKIVHLAAQVSVSSSVRDPRSSIDVNIKGTALMLEHARKTDVSRFVYASSAAVYGSKARPSREDDLPQPLSPYAASKLAGEYYCKVYAELYGLPTIVLRYFNVYGPGQSNSYAAVISQMTTRILHGKPPVVYGDGEQVRDFIFVGDVVEATVRSLDADVQPGTVLNVGTGKATTVNALARKILAKLRARNLRAVRAPPRAGDIRYSNADVSRTRRLIGFQPKYSLDQGLTETIEWFRQRKKP